MTEMPVVPGTRAPTASVWAAQPPSAMTEMCVPMTRVLRKRAVYLRPIRRRAVMAMNAPLGMSVQVPTAFQGLCLSIAATMNSAPRIAVTRWMAAFRLPMTSPAMMGVFVHSEIPVVAVPASGWEPWPVTIAMSVPDSCDPVNGCTYLNQAVACENGNNCTENDYCQAGSARRAPMCAVVKPMRTVPEKRMETCATGLSFATKVVPYSCQVAAETIVTCDDSSDTSCMGNLCDPGTGTCAMGNVNEGGACEDGDLCSLNDTCASGTCAGGALKSCDDGNVCTDDSCVEGVCVFTANDVACDDGNACTRGCLSGRSVFGCPCYL